MNEIPRDIYGLPVIRNGDNVFIIGKIPDPWEQFKEWNKLMLNKTLLSLYSYRCPFDFITEHEQWFEWKKREHFDKEPTGKIITDMLDDVERIKDHQFPVEFMFRESNPMCSGIHPMDGRRVATNPDC